MGRHSRRGPAPKGDNADAPAAAREDRAGRPGRRRMPAPPANGVPGPVAQGTVPGGAWGQTAPQPPDGTPAHGVPRLPDGTPAQGFPRVQGGTQAQGFPRFPDGTPAHGSPRVGGGASAQGAPGGAPARGVPRFPGGTPAQGMPQVRGGHPEQREAGGGWGDVGGRAAAGPQPGVSAPGRPTGPGVPFPRQRQAPEQGPRRDYLDAFGEDDDVFSTRTQRRTPVPAQAPDPYASVTDWRSGDAPGTPGADDAAPTGEPAPAKGGKGRTFTGIAAAAVTTVLAVVVAGQVADGQNAEGARSQAATDQARDVRDPASRADERPIPSASGAAAPLTYEQKMAKTYPLGATYKGSGKFEAIPGIDKAPGTGQKYTYRVDVEQGLGLDGELFAQAVQKTLNDNRSWAHNGARTFERIHSGQPDFVITLASPGTTADWCAKSGLDTTEDNVSCDSAATERVMINAYRWAQGAEPFGDQIHAYRQMLINHEVGHRIGYNHVSCDKDGELAPVMQQQTKFVDHDGIDCRPNAWAYPNG
ncbi:DUF3152 domain-containing protein [Streptomyces flaveolus]|uniref:DUF3152 domain-containing protein n=1 Tax=Streptomyces flaveolus TaxID=67297 RepID=UPI001670D3B1|nr:DUF3152 domain-containing protein [Streptomyces flaveolus]GGQ51475.1 hypothetical protein GCM10010216_10080 [Streptomyces flaveolus]